MRCVNFLYEKIKRLISGEKGQSKDKGIVDKSSNLEERVEIKPKFEFDPRTDLEEKFRKMDTIVYAVKGHPDWGLYNSRVANAEKPLELGPQHYFHEHADGKRVPCYPLDEGTEEASALLICKECNQAARLIWRKDYQDPDKNISVSFDQADKVAEKISRQLGEFSQHLGVGVEPDDQEGFVVSVRIEHGEPEPVLPARVDGIAVRIVHRDKARAL